MWLFSFRTFGIFFVQPNHMWKIKQSMRTTMLKSCSIIRQGGFFGCVIGP
ncbi:hypothetical protein HanRHA438_Chr16g0773661 [Helianthus annuus]|nr:hypothetical protein HanRHA438_Chr16g0773661 [Helianthus annuus]